MRLIVLILIALLISACNWGPWAKDNNPKTSNVLSQEVKERVLERVQTYCTLSKPEYDKSLAITAKCDAHLFTSLHGKLCDYVEITQFENTKKPGQLCRRPGCPCYDEENLISTGSRSRFSKDMASGSQSFLVEKPDLDLIQRVVDYGDNNNWQVCVTDDPATNISICQMSPKLIVRWKNLLDMAKGKPVTPEEDKKEIEFLLAVGFEAHQRVLGIANEWRIYSGISDFSKSELKRQAEREPLNLLYQAMYAKFFNTSLDHVAIALLDMFPENRLPTSFDDWTADYIFQRDHSNSKDWVPCSETVEPDNCEFVTHTGTDFLMVAWVLLTS